MKHYTIVQQADAVRVRVTCTKRSHDLDKILPFQAGDTIPFSFEADSPGLGMLALALLWSATANFATAYLWHSEFARLFLAPCRGPEWRTTSEEITTWLVAEIANRLNVVGVDGGNPIDPRFGRG